MSRIEELAEEHFRPEIRICAEELYNEALSSIRRAPGPHSEITRDQ